MAFLVGTPDAAHPPHGGYFLSTPTTRGGEIGFHPELEDTSYHVDESIHEGRRPWPPRENDQDWSS